MSGEPQGDRRPLPESGPDLHYRLGGRRYESLDDMPEGFEQALYRQMASEVEREVKRLKCDAHSKFPRVILAGDLTSISYEIDACCPEFEETVRAVVETEEAG